MNSSNRWLQERILPEMLLAKCSGTTGLVVGTEALSIQASLEAETLILEGFLLWVSNLQPNNFVVACIAKQSKGEPLVIAVPSSAKGLRRGEDLQLLGLQASWTSSLDLASDQLVPSVDSRAKMLILFYRKFVRDCC